MLAGNAKSWQAGAAEARRPFCTRSSVLGALCSPRAAARDILAVCDTGDTEFVCATRLAAIRELTTSRQGSSTRDDHIWFPLILSRLLILNPQNPCTFWEECRGPEGPAERKTRSPCRCLPSLEIRRSNPVGHTGVRLPHEDTSSGYNFTTWRGAHVHHSLIPPHRPHSVP